MTTTSQLKSLGDISVEFYNIKKNLQDFLPSWKKQYATYPAYHDLCVTYYFFLEAFHQGKDIKKMQQQLKHSMKVFDNLCKYTDSSEIQDAEKKQVTKVERTRSLDNLYKEHIENIGK